MTVDDLKHLAVLERRLAHLACRIRATSRALAYDTAELEALQWALAKLGVHTHVSL